MAAEIAPDQWLQFLREEYLEGALQNGSYRPGFIKEGGASVKIAVPLEEEDREQIENDIADLSRRLGYVVARVSSADTRVHMIDQVFFRVAEQVPWQELSRAVILKLARVANYVTPSSTSEALLSELAAANAIGPEMLMMEARTWIENRVFREQSLARDFRIAVTRLCLAELSGGPDGATIIEVVTDWLTGRNRAIAAVRPYQIYSRISRSNARYLLESLLHWIRFAGYPGLVILLDTSRLTIARNPRDDRLYYTKAAMLDAYEVLRQSIDGTDRMKGCLLVVTPAPEFLVIEPGSRGMGDYNALKLRVYDEVRDQRLVNPMGAMVRLSRKTRAV
jgi:hypothetical protein